MSKLEKLFEKSKVNSKYGFFIFLNFEAANFLRNN